jgi:hypothetical protein
MVLDPGAVVAERFEVERLAGRGGAGVVFRARDRLSGEPVALKVLRGHDGVQRSRFVREAAILAELRHPAVVRYVAHGDSESAVWLAMEWLEGETLSARLRRGKLPPADAVVLAADVAGALAAAHGRGIVHRDLKPSNLFLVAGATGAPPRVRVLDFGVARLLAQPMTRTGAVIGTPGYMAPEQVRGASEVDARADLFALGCVLFECLTGERAFGGDQAMPVLLRILLEEAPRLADVDATLPEELDALLARLLAKAPAERPASAREVLAELGRISQSGAGGAAPASLRGRAITRSEQRPLTLVLARAARCGAPGAGERAGALAAKAPAAAGDGLEDTAAAADTAPTACDPGIALEALTLAVEDLDERLEVLADGTLVIIVTREGAPTDRAARAARCALALLREQPDLELALATGRAEMGREASVREVIGRGAALLAAGARAPGIRLDAASAALLEADFEVERSAAPPLLLGPRRPRAGARTLLGRPTPCVGRERQLANLHALLGECVGEPRARAVLISGAPGVGKSRLRHEFQRSLSDAEVWLARGDPMRAGAAFGMLGQALLAAAGALPDDTPAARRKKLLARLGRHLAESDADRVASFLGEVCGVPFSDRQRLPLAAARRDPVLLGDQVRRAFEDLVSAECAARPLVLVLEDLQWGDLPTVQLLDAALRRAATAPLLVLAVARPEVHETFPALWAERALSEVRLGPLTEKAAARLVREALGERLAPAEVATLVDRSGGNAFHLEELVRAVFEGRGDALPETVIAMAEGRLSRLDPEARRVLRAASVFGASFQRAGLAALLGERDAADLDAWLALCASEEVIGPRRAGDGDAPGGEEWEFRHALLREAAYAALTDDDRRLGHRLAGEHLDGSGRGDPAELAEHFERGDRLERAAGWWRRAAELALRGNDLHAAATRAERAVRCGASGEVLAGAQLVAAEARRWMGDVLGALAAGEAALRAASPGGTGWYAASAEVAFAAAASGQLERLDALAEQVVAAAPPEPRVSPDAETLRLEGRERGTPAGGVRAARLAFDGATENERSARHMALAQLVVQLLTSGRRERAAALADALDAETGGDADLDGDPVLRAAIYRARAARALYAGDAGGYLALSQQRLPVLEEAGDLRGTCLARGTMGYAFMTVGAWEEAERTLRQALATAAQLGLAFATRHAEHNLGLVLAMRGDPAAGLAIELRAAEAYRLAGDARLRGACLVYASFIHALGGDGASAAGAAAEAVELLAAAPPYRVAALAALAEAQLLGGDGRRALATAEEAMALFRSLGAVEEGEARCRLVHARALLACGRDAEARRVLERAAARVRERAARIGDARWRRSFLERVSEHAETLRLATPTAP